MLLVTPLRLGACSQKIFKNLLSEIESAGNFGYKSLLKMYCFNEWLFY